MKQSTAAQLSRIWLGSMLRPRWAWLVLALTILSSVVRAQSSQIQCISRDQLTQWPAQFGSGSGPKYVPRSQALKRLVSGTYDIDVVTTEGLETAEVSRWRIVIVPTDSLWPSSTFGVARRRPDFVGTRVDVPKQTPLDSLRRARFLGGLSDFVMGVDSVTGAMNWHTAPGILDAGVFFTVAQVDSTGFDGRWTDGGIVMAVLKRGTLTVGERARGYYCARRVN